MDAAALGLRPVTLGVFVLETGQIGSVGPFLDVVKFFR